MRSRSSRATEDRRDELGDARVGERDDISFSSVASSPTIATSPGVAAPSRSSIARYDGRNPYTSKSRARALASLVGIVGDADRERGEHFAAPAARPSSAAAVIVGTVCDASVAGPVIHVTVPSATVPASSSIFGPSAATSTGGGGDVGDAERRLRR